MAHNALSNCQEFTRRCLIRKQLKARTKNWLLLRDQVLHLLPHLQAICFQSLVLRQVLSPIGFARASCIEVPGANLG